MVDAKMADEREKLLDGMFFILLMKKWKLSLGCRSGQ